MRLRFFKDPVNRKLFLWPACSSALLGVVGILCMWLQVSDFGPSKALSAIVDGTGSVSVGCVIGTAGIGVLCYPISLLLSLFLRTSRSDNVRALFLGLLFAAVPSFLMTRPMWLIRRPAFERAAKRGEVLIDAINRYAADNKKYPVFVELLVPKYLPHLPFTGLLGYPDFHYERIDDPAGEGTKFKISIPCTWLLDFDEFFYLSSQECPKDQAVYKRVGSWYYCRRRED